MKKVFVLCFCLALTPIFAMAADDSASSEGVERPGPTSDGSTIIIDVEDTSQTPTTQLGPRAKPTTQPPAPAKPTIEKSGAKCDPKKDKNCNKCDIVYDSKNPKGPYSCYLDRNGCTPPQGKTKVPKCTPLDLKQAEKGAGQLIKSDPEGKNSVENIDELSQIKKNLEGGGYIQPTDSSVGFDEYREAITTPENSPAGKIVERAAKTSWKSVTERTGLADLPESFNRARLDYFNQQRSSLFRPLASDPSPLQELRIVERAPARSYSILNRSTVADVVANPPRSTFTYSEGGLQSSDTYRSFGPRVAAPPASTPDSLTRGFKFSDVPDSGNDFSPAGDGPLPGLSSLYPYSGVSAGSDTYSSLGSIAATPEEEQALRLAGADSTFSTALPATPEYNTGNFRIEDFSKPQFDTAFPVEQSDIDPNIEGKIKKIFTDRITPDGSNGSGAQEPPPTFKKIVEDLRNGDLPSAARSIGQSLADSTRRLLGNPEFMKGIFGALQQGMGGGGGGGSGGGGGPENNPSNTNSVRPSVPQIPMPRATLSCKPTVTLEGASSDVRWSCLNATGSKGEGIAVGAGKVQGQEQVVLSTTQKTKKISLTCVNAQKESTPISCAIKTIFPKVVPSNTPATIGSGEHSYVGWVSDDVIDCSLFGPGGAIKSGQKSGIAKVENITSSSQYVIACRTDAGTTLQKEVLVTVNGYSGEVRKAKVAPFEEMAPKETNVSSNDPDENYTPTYQADGLTATDDMGNTVKLCDPSVGIDRFTDCLLENE